MAATKTLTQLATQQLEHVRAYYEQERIHSGPIGRWYRGTLARQLRAVIPADASVLEIGCSRGDLLACLPNRDIAGIDVSEARIAACRTRFPHGLFRSMAGEELDLGRTFDCIVISDTLNVATDVQLLLQRAHGAAHPATRLILNFQNHLWRPLLESGAWLGLKEPQPVNNWLSKQDVANLLHLADWQVVSSWQSVLMPVPLLGLDRLINRWVAPLFEPLGLVVFSVARPVPLQKSNAHTVSVVIPARNEAGNIEDAVLRTPEMGAGTELIFVEGHSRDETWDAIQRAQRAHPERKIKILQQTGKGKGNAVREGFAQAEGDILMILDADLTMPPEELPKFYDALASNRADFANGSRLVYPMEKHAMQFLNMCANKTFGLLFSWMLGQSIKDTLCGTKALRRADYERIAANRAYFGDFDPFGDFDLLFGASKLGLKIADIPIRYRERTYGATNIQRWRHGWLLLRMVIHAARKIRFI